MPAPDLREQIQRLEELLSVDPDNIPVRHRLLRCQRLLLHETGHDPDIAAAFEANVEVLYAISPRDPLVNDVLAARLGLEARLPEPVDPEAQYYLSSGAAALDAEDLPAAQTLLQSALLCEPDAPAVHAALVSFWLADGSPAAALGHADFLRDTWPDSAVVLTLSAEVAVALGRRREGLAELLRALARNPLYTPAERNLVSLGEQLGFRWLRLPLHPGVWPVLSSDGKARLEAAAGLPAGVRAAWSAWANEMLRRTRNLPAEAAPLAGLPRNLSLLQDAHGELLHAWRVRRWLRRWGRGRQPTELVLDWLAQVSAAGLLDAYLFFSYLHPDLHADYDVWCRRQPGAMEQFLREWVIHWTESGEEFG